MAALTPEYVRNCLQYTLLPDRTKRQEGERNLKNIEQTAEFARLLLHIVGSPGWEQHIRLAASVTLKNFVRKYWPGLEQAENRDFEVLPADRDLLKTELVPLMYRVPQVIQKVIGETINLIAWVDFPKAWPQLLPDLTARFESGEIDAILGSLRTANGLFKHYRVAFESAGLWNEIKVVLKDFAPHFTSLFLVSERPSEAVSYDLRMSTLSRIPELERLSKEGTNSAGATETLKNAFLIILYCCKIYHSLIFQELPQVFEDELAGWMGKFEELLKYENNDLRSDNDDEPGVLNKIKSEICDILTLFAFKYDEDFDRYVQSFVQAVIWLLMRVSQLMQDDSLAFSAMEFMSKTLAQNKCKDAFHQEGFLEGMCEKIVVPNIQFRKSDADDFEQNPDEFIKRDIEGSDLHTRRRAAADLVRAATKHYEERVTKYLIIHIGNLIKEFSNDPARNWKFKDSAIFLTAALASKGQTARFGTTGVNPLVDVVGFCQSNVAPHLNLGPAEQPVLQADCLKFIVSFRAQLPKHVLIACFPAIVTMLDSPNPVVHTYAAHCLERLFTTRDLTSGLFTVVPAELSPFLLSLDNTVPNPTNSLLSHLMAVRYLSGPDAENPEGRLEENEYTMKCIMRTLSYFQQLVLPHLDIVVPALMRRIRFAIKNPGNPRYDHYLFESLALCINIACQANPQSVELFESTLFPEAVTVLQTSVEAFFPYVFQLLALLLEHRVGLIPDPYMQLLDPLLNPALLENESHIPSIVRLLGAFFEANAVQVASRLTNVLTVFQYLISRKKYDHEGFNLIRPIIDKSPQEAIRDYMTGIFSSFFKRLSASKTDKFIKNLNPFLFFFVVRHGPTAFIHAVDQVQKGIFGMLMEKIMLPEIGKLIRQQTRKLCVVGGILLLTETSEMLGGPYDMMWNPLLQTVVKLMELPPEKEEVEDLHMFDLSSDEPGLAALPTQATMQNQLVFAKKGDRDPVADKGDVKKFLATQLAKLSASKPGIIRMKLNDSLPEVQACVGAYCQAAGVTIM